MSNTGSKKSLASSKTTSAAGGSVYSQQRQIARKINMREEMISKKIIEIFKEKETKMMRVIETTIYDDKLKIYKLKRAEYDEELTEIEKERQKIIRNRKKNKKDRNKALKANTRASMLFIVKALQATVLHYKEIYYENDYYRYKKLFELSATASSEPKRQALQLAQLNEFFNSPFKDDRRFTIKFMSQITRDRLNESKDYIESLFFDKIFNLMLKTTDEQNRLMAFDIVCYLVNSDVHRKRFVSQGYFKQIYQAMRIGEIDEKTLNKLSWLTALICFHADMIDQIIQLKLLSFIIKLIDSKFASTVRQNAVLGISLLTYHEKLFDELIQNGVIDLVMELCIDKNCDIAVKTYSTLALVHFALSKHSIKILIDKGIMDLFNGLNSIDNVDIQTNVSWIFLALCNNGITGRQMLENGITRDMFLVSCNPQFHQIRHLVIAGFAELGRSTDFKHALKSRLHGTLQRIKEKAIVGMHETFRGAAEHTIDVLLRFSISKTGNFKLTAFRALKDYILLNHDCLIADLSGIICAFVQGSASESDDLVRLECANAVSFLITQYLVFTKPEMEKRTLTRPPDLPAWEFHSEQNYILDALMSLTGSDSRDVRTRAFSTLSTLSTYASQNPHVMAQIQQDIKLPDNIVSRQYFQFIQKRLEQSEEAFSKKYMTERIEQDYAGLFCLLRLAQEPTSAVTEEATVYLHAFFFPEHHQNLFRNSQSFGISEEQKKDQKVDNNQQLTKEEKEKISVYLYADECHHRNTKLDPLNEKFFMYVFKALLFTPSPRVVYQLLDVVNFYINHESPYQKEILDPTIILWMLKILQKHRKDAELSLLTAKTILRVVANHQIEFEYQEMAIIKKFNLALENIDADPNAEIAKDSDSEELEQEQEPSEQESEHISNAEIEKHMKDQLQTLIAGDAQMEVVEGGSEKQPLNSDGSVKDAAHIQDVAKSDPDVDSEEQKINKQKKMGQYRPSEASNTDNDFHDLQKKESDLNSFQNPLSSLEIISMQMSAHQENQSKDRANSEELINVQEIDNSRNTGRISAKQSKTIDDKKTLNEVIASSEIRSPKSRTNIRSSNYSSEQPKMDGNLPIKMFLDQSQHLRETPQRKSIFKDRSSSQTTTPTYDPNAELRDTLIKSFMLVFTNEKSQHLLLNKDIIEIAFNCLEYCSEISIEAKINLSRLISIIFKFPQVQEHLHKSMVIEGLVHLLQQDERHQNIISYTVEACNYISLNFNFLNSEMSLRLLQALTPLLARLSDQPIERLQKKHVDLTMTSDKENCIFAISNLVKGRTQNSSYFIQNDGPRLIMQHMMQQNCSEEVLELCIGCIKQFADQKVLFKKFLLDSQANQSLLPGCLLKCLNLSDSWFTCSREIHLFKKIFSQLTMTDEGKRQLQEEMNMKKQKDVEQIMNMNYKNIGELQTMDFINSQNDLSIKMAAKCKIRSHAMFTAAACVRLGLSIECLIEDGRLIHRVLQDLKMDNLNDYIYQSLIQVLQSCRKQPDLLLYFFSQYTPQIIELLKTSPIIEKKVALFKMIVYLALSIPQELCQSKPDVFGSLFDLAKNQTNDEIIENVLWLISSMLSIKESEQQHQDAIQVCLQYKVHTIIFATIQHENETIILQALKTLATMASIPSFRATLVIENGDVMFPILAQIINERQLKFTKMQLDIETTLVEVLALISESEVATKDPITVAAKRRVVQQGFMEHFLVRISCLQYQIENDSFAEIEEDNQDMVEMFGDKIEKQYSIDGNLMANDLPVDFISQDLLEELQEIEDANKIKGTNQLIENTFRLASNVSELHETHLQLVTGNGRLIEQVLRIFMSFIQKANQVDGKVEMLQFSYNNLRISKYISYILVQTCSNQYQSVIDPAIMQDICLKKNVHKVLKKVVKKLIDYDLHSNVYKALSTLVLSTNFNIQKKAVEQGCLQELIEASEKSQYFRVRRLCQTAIDAVDANLVELNERLRKKRPKINN